MAVAAGSDNALDDALAHRVGVLYDSGRRAFCWNRHRARSGGGGYRNCRIRRRRRQRSCGSFCHRNLFAGTEHFCPEAFDAGTDAGAEVRERYFRRAAAEEGRVNLRERRSQRHAAKNAARPERNTAEQKHPHQCRERAHPDMVIEERAENTSRQKGIRRLELLAFLTAYLGQFPRVLNPRLWALRFKPYNRLLIHKPALTVAYAGEFALAAEPADVVRSALQAQCRAARRKHRLAGGR